MNKKLSLAGLSPGIHKMYLRPRLDVIVLDLWKGACGQTVKKTDGEISGISGVIQITEGNIILIYKKCYY